jgi:hypothetical protein
VGGGQIGGNVELRYHMTRAEPRSYGPISQLDQREGDCGRGARVAMKYVDEH